MKPILVDTHAHLCDPVFDHDRREVIDRALQAGVGAVIIVGENLDNAERNIELAGKYPCLKPAGGLYPEYADSGEADRLAGYIRKNRENFCAIGEVGLDFWIAGEDDARELQRHVFRQFINLAMDLDLPLNVHSRSAGRHAVAMLLDSGATRVQMHAFDGKASAALPAVEAGYFFSIPPSVSRSRQKQKLLKHLPLSCLLAESDSPVLGPDPAVRNEPANIIQAIEAIAAIKDIPRQQAVEALQENTRKLYGF
jgi:TatD DNase family protein